MSFPSFRINSAPGLLDPSTTYFLGVGFAGDAVFGGPVLEPDGALEPDVVGGLAALEPDGVRGLGAFKLTFCALEPDGFGGVGALAFKLTFCIPWVSPATLGTFATVKLFVGLLPPGALSTCTN